MKNLEKIHIKNKQFEIDVYLEKSIFSDLKSKKSKSGETKLSLLESGRFARGMKHLLQTLQAKDKNKKIVLFSKETKTDKDFWYVNLDEYSKIVSGRFFSLYRETGLDGAMHYLSDKIPKDFQYDKKRVSDSQIKKIDANLPQTLVDLEKKAKNKKVILKHTAESIKSLKNQKSELAKSIVELKNIQNESSIAVMRASLDDLDERLSGKKTYKETSGKGNWQEWIKNNSWLMGVNYNEPIEKQKVGFDNIPDYLFPTIDGFIDVLEIKLPTHDCILDDSSSHANSFKWSSKASEAIGQVVTYLHEIEKNHYQIQERIKEICKLDLLVIRPRIYIIIGNSNHWDNVWKRALRKLNYSLHGIEVLTYSDLKNRGEQIIKMYENKNL